MGKKSKPKTFYQDFKLGEWSRRQLELLKSLVMSPDHLMEMSFILLICEFVISVFVVKNVKYTEIDWIAYMQEVEGFLNGTMDYTKLKGDTGPLVYPAGFVYFYSVLYYITDKGKNIRLAQYFFVLFYIIFLALVFRVYVRTQKVPGYALAIMCFTTYRIHSIFMLRLFNDPIAMIFLYASLNLFLDNHWTLGSIFYSLSVSIKMNTLLFSPALLLGYLICLGFKNTLKQLFICAFIQIAIGLPFMLDNLEGYVVMSFDLRRVFLHKWTVNWRFIPEPIFTHPAFHLCLLFCHVTALAFFYKTARKYYSAFIRLKCVESDIKKNCEIFMGATGQLFVLPFFMANFIGIVFSRSLHYQFYVWYYHTLPYLLWTTRFSVVFKLFILGLIEMAWNTYPSTYFSSAILHFSHFIIIIGVYRAAKANVKLA